MSEEITNQEPAATDAMQRSIEALERKNSELITELRAAKSKASKVPDGVNVEELLEFKRTHEQQQLESQGNYTEARQALEQQYREATAQKDQRIESLEAKVRELELIAPAVTALAEIVHDPDLVLRSKLSADKIERDTLGVRPMPSYRTSSKYLMKGNEQLDALAVSAYGARNEASWYAIADANADNIIANKGDFTTIRTLIIPEF